MDQEQQAISELDRANRAKRLLEDELLRSAFDDLKQSFRNAWENTRQDDPEGRENLYLSLRLLKAVENTLEEHVRTGQMAKVALEAIRAGNDPRRSGP